MSRSRQPERYVVSHPTERITPIERIVGEYSRATAHMCHARARLNPRTSPHRLAIVPRPRRFANHPDVRARELTLARQGGMTCFRAVGIPLDDRPPGVTKPTTRPAVSLSLHPNRPGPGAAGRNVLLVISVKKPRAAGFVSACSASGAIGKRFADGTALVAIECWANAPGIVGRGVL